MSKFKSSPDFLRQLREWCVECGKTAGERVSQQPGAVAQMDFMDMEQLAAVIAAGLSEGLATTLLDKKAQTLNEEQPCPKCGASCSVQYQDRPLTLETGQVLPLHEPICYCPKCKRDFFPPADLAGTR